MERLLDGEIKEGDVIGQNLGKTADKLGWTQVIKPVTYIVHAFGGEFFELVRLDKNPDEINMRVRINNDTKINGNTRPEAFLVTPDLLKQLIAKGTFVFEAEEMTRAMIEERNLWRASAEQSDEGIAMIRSQVAESASGNLPANTEYLPVARLSSQPEADTHVENAVSQIEGAVSSLETIAANTYNLVKINSVQREITRLMGLRSYISDGFKARIRIVNGRLVQLHNMAPVNKRDDLEKSIKAVNALLDTLRK